MNGVLSKIYAIATMGWREGGKRDTKSAYGTLESAWRFIFLRCMRIIIIILFIPPPSPSFSALSFLFYCEHFPAAPAPASKEFRKGAIGRLLANYSDTVYDPALRCIVQ